MRKRDPILIAAPLGLALIAVLAISVTASGSAAVAAGALVLSALTAFASIRLSSSEAATQTMLATRLQEHAEWLRTEGASGTRAVLSKMDLRDLNLSGAQLAGADLSGVDLSGSTLTRADFAGAELRHASLIGILAESTDFSDADLRGADLSSAKLDHAHLVRCILDGATLTGASLVQAHLASASMRSVRLNEATAEGCDFTNADLIGADLSGSRLVDATFTGTRLVGVDFRGTHLAATDPGAALVREPLIDSQSEDLGGTLGDALRDQAAYSPTRGGRRATYPTTGDYEVIIGRHAIEQRVTELANQINTDYADRDLVLIAVLKGSFVFASDLLRQISVPVDVEFVQASSFRSGMEPGELDIHDLITVKLTNRDVLVIEDIVETGQTLSGVISLARRHSPATLASCVLLVKPGHLKTDVQPEYVGFNNIPDVFVVGYGLDFDNKYRNLPEVAAVDATGELLHTKA